MLTNMMVEEEFELKEAEPWFDKRDLEHDLQLAAELGKSLLERNRELEQGLQQMYGTNQEQLQEIEHLTKQVDLLRQVNDQHAKVYEQLDVSARELEQSNHKLCQDNRAAQQKIHGLTETVELLQTQVDELQQQAEEMKLSPRRPSNVPAGGGGAPRGAQSVACLKELQNALRRPDCDPDDDPAGDPRASDVAWREEEQASLRQSLRALQTQFAGERARREEAERAVDLLTGENAALEQQLAAMETCQARVSELEREAEELRHLWKSRSPTRSARPEFPHGPPSPLVLLNPEEDGERLPTAGRAPDSPRRLYEHECACVRRAEAVKYRGISLLNEVDAQYSALQVKYDELLRRCQQGLPEDQQDGPSHKAVQTASPAAAACPARSHMEDFEDDFHQPEYKELFREIFSRIQKTKEDLIENRARASAGDAPPVSR